MFTVVEVPRKEWLERVPHIPHDVFEYNDDVRGVHLKFPVQTIIEIQLDGQPWLWQTICWVDDMGAARGGAHFETWDEGGDTQPWSEVIAEPSFVTVVQVVDQWYDAQVRTL